MSDLILPLPLVGGELQGNRALTGPAGTAKPSGERPPGARTIHWTSYEALKHGVRKCVVIADRGRNLTVEIDKQIVTIPRNSVHPTAHMALDEAHRQKRLECVRALRYWAGRLRQQIGVQA